MQLLECRAERPGGLPKGGALADTRPLSPPCACKEAANAEGGLPRIENSERTDSPMRNIRNLIFVLALLRVSSGLYSFSNIPRAILLVTTWPVRGLERAEKECEENVEDQHEAYEEEHRQEDPTTGQLQQPRLPAT